MNSPQVKRRILLTVPHAVCSESMRKDHQCDFAARDMSIKFENAVSSLPNVSVTRMAGDMKRTDCDLNRNVCLHTSFRRRVHTFLLEERPDFLFDIHSFPVEINEWASLPLVLLVNVDPAWKIFAHSFAAFRLKNRMKESGIPIQIQNGNQQNSIVLEALALGIPGLLFEFNESNSVMMNERLMILITRWISEDLDCPLLDLTNPFPTGTTHWKTKEDGILIVNTGNRELQSPVTDRVVHVSKSSIRFASGIQSQFSKPVHLRIEKDSYIRAGEPIGTQLEKQTSMDIRLAGLFMISVVSFGKLQPFQRFAVLSPTRCEPTSS